MMWFTITSSGADSYDGEMCATREEAIAQGREYYGDDETFCVAMGKRLTAEEVAQWCCDQIWWHLENREMEEELETGAEEPLFEKPKTRAIEDEFVAAIAALIEKHKMLKTWYRWTDYEEIKP